MRSCGRCQRDLGLLSTSSCHASHCAWGAGAPASSGSLRPAPQKHPKAWGALGHSQVHGGLGWRSHATWVRQPTWAPTTRQAPGRSAAPARLRFRLGWRLGGYGRQAPSPGGTMAWTTRNPSQPALGPPHPPPASPARGPPPALGPSPASHGRPRPRFPPATVSRPRPAEKLTHLTCCGG